MAGMVRAVIFSPSCSILSDPQASSPSIPSGSSSPFQHLIRLPRKCSPGLRVKLCSSSSSSSSQFGLSLRFSQIQANSQLPSSPSPLFTLSSLRKSAIGEEAVVMPVSHLLLRILGAFSTGSLVLVSAGAAVAETIDVTKTTNSNGEPPTDYLLSSLFIASFIGLLIVTVGAIYLGVTEFLESRQRTAMQKAAGEEKILKREKRGVVKAGSGKGFGVRKSERKTEKDE